MQTQIKGHFNGLPFDVEITLPCDAKAFGKWSIEYYKEILKALPEMMKSIELSMKATKLKGDGHGKL